MKKTKTKESKITKKYTKRYAMVGGIPYEVHSYPDGKENVIIEDVGYDFKRFLKLTKDFPSMHREDVIEKLKSN